MKLRKVYVYYDNWCPNCISFKKKIERLDAFNKIVFKPIRNIENKSLNNLNIDLAYKKMASTENYKTWHYGYSSLQKIFLRIPFLWLFAPIFYILKTTGIGNYLYNELALKRKIIPFHCDKHCDIN